MELLAWAQDLGLDFGFVIGLALVVVAIFLLPVRVRWYVATAGLAVLFFRVYQKWWANKLLKELDREREELKSAHEELRKRRAALEEQHETTLRELEKKKREIEALVERREQLDERAAEASAEKAEVDARIGGLEKEREKVFEDLGAVLDVLGSFADADRAAESALE